MKVEDINSRLEEIPAILENLRAEFNQLLGYKKALLDAEENKEPKKDKEK